MKKNRAESISSGSDVEIDNIMQMAQSYQFNTDAKKQKRNSNNASPNKDQQRGRERANNQQENKFDSIRWPHLDSLQADME